MYKETKLMFFQNETKKFTQNGASIFFSDFDRFLNNNTFISFTMIQIFTITYQEDILGSSDEEYSNLYLIFNNKLFKKNKVKEYSSEKSVNGAKSEVSSLYNALMVAEYLKKNDINIENIISKKKTFFPKNKKGELTLHEYTGETNQKGTIIYNQQNYIYRSTNHQEQEEIISHLKKQYTL